MVVQNLIAPLETSTISLTPNPNDMMLVEGSGTGDVEVRVEIVGFGVVVLKSMRGPVSEPRT